MTDAMRDCVLPCCVRKHSPQLNDFTNAAQVLFFSVMLKEILDMLAMPCLHLPSTSFHHLLDNEYTP